MKLFFLLTAATIFTASCSPKFYQQIATLSSESVELHTNGDFLYIHTDVTIKYNFWSESGNFSFDVSNCTDNDIYLNLGASHFVNNGYASDYYQARKYITSSTSGSTVKKNSFSLTNIDKSYSVEHTEQEIVCIPSHSTKSFSEFYVADAPHRECGLIRDPSSKENAAKEYGASDSPRVIENRLVFVIDGANVMVNNIFYVSEYKNIAVNDAEEQITIRTCSGREQVRFNKLCSSNRFYILYSESDIYKTGNDRTRQTGRIFKDIY